MTSDVLERLHTNAEAPMQSLRSPPAIVGRFYGCFAFGPIVDSTTADYDVVTDYSGTQADPGCRLVVQERSHAHVIHEIRLLSGLTWQELAELFRVSRRSIHNWANGEPLKIENALAIDEVLRAVQGLRRASAAETRLALLTPLSSGTRALDLLAAKRWDDAISAVISLPPICVPDSPYAEAPPRHPTTYFGALNDRPVPTSGHSVPGRSRRVTRQSQ
jgi:transcriptional regulator with XRE-family HTH domain